MNAPELTNKAVAIASVAILFAGSATAGPVLCEDSTLPTFARSSCPDSHTSHVKNQQRIDHLLNTATPTFAPAGSKDWRVIEATFNSGRTLVVGPQLSSWIPSVLSSAWGFNDHFDSRARQAEVPAHIGPPTRNVPEPGSLALLGIGLIGVTLAVRRKRI